MVSVAELCEDLQAESDDLRTLLEPLDEAAWDTPTPAPGWSIRDQVSHLAYFDDAARTAIADPERFVVERDAAMADIDGMTQRVAATNRHRPGPELLAWLAEARAALVAAARAADPAVRVPWYGPPMSVASQITARIMETWAHGQDVADALGVVRRPTDRLRHVAFLGVATFANSFAAHGQAVPELPVRVELTAPEGERWDYGPPEAADRVRGPALDFALVVTQRRHLDDVDLAVSGPVASAWMAVAQAFAGPPGPGRRRGQFSGTGGRAQHPSGSGR
jgi:uncharacterized protein (TIGR03084 family)